MSLEEIGEQSAVNHLKEDEDNTSGSGGGVEMSSMSAEGSIPMRMEETDNDLMVDRGIEPEAKVTAASSVVVSFNANVVFNNMPFLFIFRRRERRGDK
eukprot:14792712-Ditylum_brightwellii.AAC.1